MEVFLIDKKAIITTIGVFIAAFFTWYLFGLYDNGNRTDAIRDQLDAVSRDQQSAIDRLGSIESGLDDSQKQVGRISDTVSEAAGSVDAAKGRIQQSQERLRTSSEIIEDCQRILKQVRERGQVGEK